MIVWLTYIGVVVVYIKALQLKTVRFRPLRIEFESLQGLLKSLQFGPIRVNFEDQQDIPHITTHTPAKKAKKAPAKKAKKAKK